MKTFLSLLFGFFILSATLVGQVPVLLSDLNQGSADGMDEFNSQGVALGDKMFLVANNGLTGLELYAIENNQITLFKDINPGGAGADISYLLASGGFLYFAANDGVHGLELWKSDGTPSGTAMLLDLAAGSTGSNPAGLLTGGDGRVYFSANGLCYATDGTVAGTVAISGPTSVDLTPDLFYLGNRATAFGNGIALATKSGFTSKVWITNGNTASTVYQSDGNASIQLFGFAPVQDGFVFTSYHFSQTEYIGVYSYKATTGTTTQISPLFAQRTIPFSSEKAILYVGNRYLITDGSVEQTLVLTDLAPNISQIQELPYAAINGKMILPGDELLFSFQVIVTDGTPAGTQLLTTVTESFIGAPWVVSGDNAFFTGGVSNGFNAQIWQTNGTAEGTMLLYEYPNSGGIKTVIPIGCLGDQLFYNSTLGGVGREVYRLAFTPITDVQQPEAPQPFALQYHLGGTARIVGPQEGELLDVDCFDANGRLLQRIRTAAGTPFELPESGGIRILRVKAQAYQQSFLLSY